MANPNIVNVTSILGAVGYAAPANTTANTLISNAASSGTIIKVNSLTCTNVTGAAAQATVSVNSAAAGGGTAYRLAYQISVPANASLQVIDKNNFVYLNENTSVVVTSGTSAAIEYVTSYETIS
jgi:hypothetical protein